MIATVPSKPWLRDEIVDGMAAHPDRAGVAVGVAQHGVGGDDAFEAVVHTPRSAFSRAIAARSSGMPSPVRDEVVSTCGKAAGRLPERGLDRGDPFGQARRLHLVGLGQHDLIADRRLAEGVEQRRRRRP